MKGNERICITGPVNSSQYFGGVATFVESLADAFFAQGHKVFIVTDYSEKLTTYKGVPILSNSKKPIRRGLKLPFVIGRKLKEIKPTIIISSLEYGLANLYFRKQSPKVKTLHFIHAFPAISTGSRIKKTLLNATLRFISRNSDLMVSNSTVTHLVNREIYGVRSDNIVGIGLGYEFLDRVKNLKAISKKNNVLFAGRLSEEKNVLSFIKAVSILGNNMLKVYIAGKGPKEAELKQYCKKNGLNVEFLGYLEHKTLYEHLKDAKVFVSLNPHEPFGIAYLEALAFECNIVCPETGGQLDYFQKFRKRFFPCNAYNIESISRAISLAVESEERISYKKVLEEEFDYRKVSSKLLNLINEA